MALVYALLDPTTGDIRYIGGSTALRSEAARRVPSEISEPAVRAWIAELAAAGQTPDVRVLESGLSLEQLAATRQEWIEAVRAKGARLLSD